MRQKNLVHISVCLLLRAFGEGGFEVGFSSTYPSDLLEFWAEGMEVSGGLRCCFVAG